MTGITSHVKIMVPSVLPTNTFMANETFCLHNRHQNYIIIVSNISNQVRKFMKKKVKYTNEPLGKLVRVKDFLPPPDQLVLKEDVIKVDIISLQSDTDFSKQPKKK